MEKSQTKYRLEFGLARLCLVKITTSLWNRQNVRNKIRFLLEKERQTVDKSYITYEISGKLRSQKYRIKLIKDVICQYDKVGLPKLMRGEFILAIKSIGFRIFEWVRYVTQELEFSYAVAEKICWTSYGTVDKVATFKLWLSNKDLDVIKLYNIACNLCLQEHITDLWKEIPSSVQNTYFCVNRLYPSFNWYFHNYWNCYKENTLSVTTRTSNIYPTGWIRNSRFKECMLNFCILEKNEVAFRFFLARLNKEQREKYFEKILMNGINWRYDIYDNFSYESLNEITAFTCIFLSEIDFDSCNSYSHINVDFFLQFLLHWPCQQILVLVLDKIWQHFDQHNYDNLIHVVTTFIVRDFDLNTDIEQSIYRTILHEVWKKSPAHFKVCVNCLEILPILLKIGDTASLNLLVNDKDFESRRQNVLWEWKALFVEFLCKCEFELMETFVNGVLKEEERSTYVRSCLYKIGFSYLIQTKFFDHNCKDFSIVKIKFEKLFTLCSLSEEEINILKRCIVVQNLAKTWCTGILLNSDRLDQVSDWCSLSTEEIKRVKTEVERYLKRDQCKFKCSVQQNTTAKFIHWCFGKKYDDQEFIKQLILES